MSKAIILNQEQWAKIHSQISKDYPPSVLLIRPTMRRVLGFTSRTHRVWIKDKNFNYSHPEDTVHLDFFDEPKRVMFLLKYGDYLK